MPVESIVPSTAGVMIVCVTRSVFSSSARSGPPMIPAGTITSVAPNAKAAIHSSTDGSKLGEQICRNRDSEVTPYRSVTMSFRPARPVWVTTTPLGLPVDPDV
ncbi:hypothetical protein L618_002100000030 [Rhodococcus rhodochrous J45]|uniref:Uncharacterized protein n=1 Tax=Rhodococcus rhodochrous J45 TaxID=935266 RepID=A0A562E434_RHORH|nr:hypothetical protein L618_002100000030 [Rhodococcus rhodochrous J45]